jgi:hypothetical protein
MSIAFPIFLQRACIPVILSLVLSACSGEMVPPEDVDNGTTVSSIEPRQKVADTNYAAPDDPTSKAAESADYLNTPNLAGVDDQPRDRSPRDQGLDQSQDVDQNQTIDQSQRVEPNERLPKIDEDVTTTANQKDIPDNGVNMDDALGVEQSNSLAEEEAVDIAEGNTDQPVVDGIGTDTPTEVRHAEVPHNETPVDQGIPFDQATSTDQVTLPSKRRQPENETQVAFIPRFADPSEVPESYGGLTAADRACRADLARLGVRYKELRPIGDGPTCGIPHPIEVSGFAGGIRLYPAAKLNCSMTRMFAKWVKNELVPTARYRYFSGIKQIHQLSSYSCRHMNSQSRNPWSEHAKGNALDVGGFILNNGKEIDVAKKGFFAFREKGMLQAVRADSCKYFNTVLGPGDAYHGNHFHFDLRYRKSGRRYCSL